MKQKEELIVPFFPKMRVLFRLELASSIRSNVVNES